jgi:predicted small lipoprotein YifL
MTKLLASLLLLLTLAACGVRGDPEAPTQFTQSQ